MLVLYTLLQLAYNLITWTMPPETQAKYQLVKLLNFRVWVILTPILTLVLIGLIVRNALRVIHKRDADHAIEVDNLYKDYLARIGEKDKEIANQKTQFDSDKDALKNEVDAIRSRAEEQAVKHTEQLGSLQSQLDAERAKQAAPVITGEIQEILINDRRFFDEPNLNVGSYVTLKAYILNKTSIPTKIRTFLLRMTVRGKVYESKVFHASGLYKAKRYGASKSAIKNLAEVINRETVLEHNRAQEGYIRFSVEGLIPSPESPEANVTWKEMAFNLSDVEGVQLTVSDYSKDHEIVSLGIEPQWANITEG